MFDAQKVYAVETTTGASFKRTGRAMSNFIEKKDLSVRPDPYEKTIIDIYNAKGQVVAYAFEVKGRA